MMQPSFYSAGLTSRSYSGLFPHYIYIYKKKKLMLSNCFIHTITHTHTHCSMCSSPPRNLLGTIVIEAKKACWNQRFGDRSTKFNKDGETGSVWHQNCAQTLDQVSDCTQIRGAWNWMLLDNTDQPSSGADLGSAAAEPDGCCSCAPRDMLH